MPCLGRVLYTSKDARSRSPKRAPCPRLACSALELVVQQERGAAVKGMEAEIVEYQDHVRQLEALCAQNNREKAALERSLEVAGQDLDMARRSQRNLRAVLADATSDLQRVRKQHGDPYKKCRLLERRVAASASASSDDLLVDMDTLYAAAAKKKQKLSAAENKILEAHLARLAAAARAVV
jgi:chromosome segregation ATPase